MISQITVRTYDNVFYEGFTEHCQKVNGCLEFDFKPSDSKKQKNLWKKDSEGNRMIIVIPLYQIRNSTHHFVWNSKKGHRLNKLIPYTLPTKAEVKKPSEVNYMKVSEHRVFKTPNAYRMRHDTKQLKSLKSTRTTMINNIRRKTPNSANNRFKMFIKNKVD